MSKRQKIWLWVIIVLVILNIILHFTNCAKYSLFGIHINYIASILSAFTLGLMSADIPRFKENVDGETNR